MHHSPGLGEAVRPYGGELSVEALPRPVQRLFDRYAGTVGRLRAFPDEPGLRRVLRTTHFGFVDNAAFNAIAGTRDGHYFIGVFGGTVLAVYDSFLRIFANPRVFPAIGDVTVEDGSSDRSLMRLTGWRERASVQQLASESFNALPRDAGRAQVALDLADLALLFVYHHEACHIAGGHLQYLAGLTGEDDSLEFGMVQSGKVPGPIARALECDADRAGGHLTTSLVRMMIERGYKSPLMSLDADLVLLLWGFAVEVLLRIMDLVAMERREADSHPHPDTRFKFFVWGSVTALQEEPGDLAAAALRGFAAAPQTADRVWGEMGWPPFRHARFDRRSEEDELLHVLDEVLPMSRIYRA